MSKLNIACLLSPMADTEGPMDIVDGKALTGSKKIMGKYGEVGLEATIAFAEERPDAIHTDLLSVGKAKEIGSLQQSAIAMIQPAKHPGTLGVHALEVEDIDNRDAFSVAELLVRMIQGLENQPQLIFAGRESWDYAHGVVGPAVAQKLDLPYYSGVNEIKINDDLASVTATFIEGADKVSCHVALPAVFGTTDWLNGKDSARFTSLKGVMMAKKFKRTISDASTDASSQTDIHHIEAVKSERKNHTLKDADGPVLAKQAVDILVNKDKALAAGGSSGDGDSAGAVDIAWSDADAASLDFANQVVLVADHDGASIRLSTRQALSQARKIADAAGMGVTLAILAERADSLGAGAAGYGADRVLAIESPHFKRATLEACATHLAALFAASQPAFFMTVANDLGRDLAAYMASGFGGGLLQDVAEIGLEDGKLRGKRIVANARFMTDESILDSGRCQSASLRATAFDPVPDERPTAFHKTAADASVSLNASVVQVEAGEQTKGIPLNEAKIIVSGGRGMKDPANFAQLDKLAALLGGAVGASRAVTDLNWVPHQLQIGQTGTTVAPDIYFAIGISGAIQHLTGMLGSRYIVAINPDEDAPIHKNADLSIIDKWENALEPLTQELSAALQ